MNKIYARTNIVTITILTYYIILTILTNIVSTVIFSPVNFAIFTINGISKILFQDHIYNSSLFACNHFDYIFKNMSYANDEDKL